MTQLEKLFERREEGRLDCSIIYMIWNGMKFIPETLPAVLKQEGVRAEIIISDDCSGDGSLDAAMEIVAKYKGPHDIVVHKTSARAETEHLPALAEQARTDLLIQAHQDDVPYPDRARTLRESFRPGVYLVTSVAHWKMPDGRVVPGNGALQARVRKIKTFEPFLYRSFGVMIGARFGMHADLFRRFPRLDRDYTNGGKDFILPIRAAMLGEVVSIDRPLLACGAHPDRWTFSLWDQQNPQTIGFGRAMGRLVAYERSLDELDQALKSGLLSQERHARLHGWVKRAREDFLGLAVQAHEKLQRKGFKLAWKAPQGETKP